MKLTREEAYTLKALLDGRVQELEALERMATMYKLDFPSLPVIRNIQAKVETYTGILPPKEEA